MTDDRCIHEMVVEQCAICMPRTMLSDPFLDPPKLGPAFEARYAGQCSDCGDRFDEGDEIRADGEGGYLGPCCAEDYTP